MNTSIMGSAAWIMAAGSASSALGLAVDAAIHVADPTLVMRESILSLGNPGHALLAAGIAATTAGAVVYAGAWALGARALGAKLVRALPAVGLATTAALAAGVIGFSGVGLAAPHEHGPAGAAVDHHEPGDGHDHHGGVTGGEGGGGGSAAPGGHNPGAVHPRHSSEPVTAEQRAGAQRLLNSIKAVAPKYATLATALAEGFREGGNSRDRSVGPAHFMNIPRVDDGKVMDPSAPEALVYWKNADGSARLIGFLFFAKSGQGPMPGGALTEWHNHGGGCKSPTGEVRDGQEACPAGWTRTEPLNEMMHVWLVDDLDLAFSHELSPQLVKALGLPSREQLRPGQPSGQAPRPGAPGQRPGQAR